jgi:aryl-alcohol dehydrogenase-like predicted oxidoreductase
VYVRLLLRQRLDKNTQQPKYIFILITSIKVFFPVAEDIGNNILARPMDDPRIVNRSGLSRKHIFEAVEGSLKRLGVSYIDLYQIHRFDYNVCLKNPYYTIFMLGRAQF